MRAIPIEELEIGDKIAIQIDEKTVEIHTIKEVDVFNYLIISEESDPMDITVDSEVFLLD